MEDEAVPISFSILKVATHHFLMAKMPTHKNRLGNTHQNLYSSMREGSASVLGNIWLLLHVMFGCCRARWQIMTFFKALQFSKSSHLNGRFIETAGSSCKAFLSTILDCNYSTDTRNSFCWKQVTLKILFILKTMTHSIIWFTCQLVFKCETYLRSTFFHFAFELIKWVHKLL